MFALLYLLAACFAGALFVGAAGIKTSEKENTVFVYAPAAFGGGLVLLTWPLYFAAWAAHALFGIRHPLLPANILVLGVTLACTVFYFKKHGTAPFQNALSKMIPDRRRFYREAAGYAFLFVFIYLTMHHALHVTDGEIRMGYTVFGDYAPPFSMIRSFSYGANFPTQYPHYGGADVRYHFMFQFLIGNLEYLKMPVTIAYNLMTALGMTGFLMILGQLAERITGVRGAGWVAAVLFFFRSGTAFFRYAAEGIRAGTFFEDLAENYTFLGYTPNENWGLWTYNVYLNQRHFGFILLISAYLIWFFLPYLEGSCGSLRTFLRKESWKAVNPEGALLAGMLLGFCSFWNGAVVIGTLLILFGMALFSDGKTDYLLTAAATFLFSFLQTKIFIFGPSMEVKFQWGFIVQEPTLLNAASFLVAVAGLTVAGSLILLVLSKRKSERIMILACLLPVVFAFTMSLTPDITVNHKYIMISMAYLGIFWGGAVVKAASSKGAAGKILAVILMIALTTTGIYDFAITIKDNGEGRELGVKIDSDVTAFLTEELTSEDLVLSPPYSVNDATLSGMMMYAGWPYYAWSAGYDTNSRWKMAQLIYSTEDPAELKETVAGEGIDYIIFEPGERFDEVQIREETIAQCYPLIYVSEDGRKHIYKTKEQ